ncbi:MAG: mitochondrial fission ELM1 family protein [Alphaproteobacteria bacterium]|nr:mitochondrial fission ELM1 family protein [Alphaproteobacteria bacterium SS10]
MIASAAKSTPKTCWVLSADAAGMRNQGLGLAEALGRRLPGFAVEAKSVGLKQPWRTLAPWLSPRSLSVLAGGTDALEAPWSDLVIGIGRQSIVPAQAIKRANPATTLIQLQRPTGWAMPFGLGQSDYDLVIPPNHDQVAPGPKVVESLGALNRITPETLRAAVDQFGKQLKPLTTPRYAVLIGGTSKTHQMTTAAASDLCNRLTALASASDCSFMITTSRRTGAEAEGILRAGLDQSPHWFWDGQGDNPYFAFLGAADAVILTNDSVSMASEAAATGKPLFLYNLPGDSQKFKRFHDSLSAYGASHQLPQTFTGSLEASSYSPLLEADRLADLVMKRFNWG